MSNKAKFKSSINSRLGTRTAFDRIRSLLSEVKKKSNEEDTSGKFYGLVLYSHKITTGQFKQIFKNNKDFTKQVMRASKITDSDKSGHFLEIFVEVPEISGLLPRPELKILMDIIKNKDEIVAAAGPLNLLITESERQRQELAAAGFSAFDNASSPSARKARTTLDAKKSVDSIFETMKIISMYPKVYKYCKKNDFVGIGTTCEVEFPCDNNQIIPTMGYGIYKESLSGPLSEEDKEILGTRSTSRTLNDIKRIIEDVSSR